MKHNLLEIIYLSVIALSIGIMTIIAEGFMILTLGDVNDNVTKSVYVIILFACSLVSLIAYSLYSFSKEKAYKVENENYLFKIIPWNILAGLFVGCLIHGVFLPWRLFSLGVTEFAGTLIAMDLIFLAVSLFACVFYLTQSIISIKECCLKNKEAEIES